MVKLGVEIIFFFNVPIGRTVFNFSCKISGFLKLFFLFWVNFLVNFLSFFLCKTSVFCEAGWYFWVKIDFFYAKLQFLRGWVVLLVPFLSFFCHFFIPNFSFLRGWEVFLRKKKTIFSCKTSVFEGLDALFEYKNEN